MNKYSIVSTERSMLQLTTIEDITYKRMFNGHGIFYEDKMFDMITTKDQHFLKANHSTTSNYTDKESLQHSKTPYYSIPKVIIKHDTLLFSWADDAIQISN